ncbi:Response regulator receiver domain-containing protein [Noviherbaspirillum humi]|uniref:Response regulator receiver domain-containing protein n=1 Tax=Noviherbaspirillum humi TaxID=1688639 RepID=A0A239BS14_9BURK|nr:tetratricopeptide repeat-containing response regulator [Noviherbaspirillum humi]SNS09844.1 Response regulator receiver domain-containing protein [Noviherbaspirillum humi]
MKALPSLTALLIEPHTGMRASLHNMLTLCGVTRIEHAVSAGAAIRSIRNREFDLVLCEYDLGDGQDGQQLLEDLRNNRLIPLSTIFMMVTAERSYEKVVSAAELAPSVYLLKPFTADALLERILRAVEKRELFMPVYALIEKGNPHAAIARCMQNEERYPRYATDFMRLRAELYINLGEARAAEQVYLRLSESKAVPWAKLGLSKSYFMQQRFEEAEQVLNNLVEENSHYMDAYDWLAATQEARGKLEEAKLVLENAVRISPHAVKRLRRLAEVAFDMDDLDLAERSFQRVIARARYSEFRDPEDHARLVQALVRRGDSQQAATIIRDLERSFGDRAKGPACRAISAAFLHAHLGNHQKAEEEVGAAIAASNAEVNISNTLKMELAKTCLASNLEGSATELMLSVMNNTPEGAPMEKALAVFEKAGRKDLGESVARESRRQVADLVANGAEKAKQGDYRGAVDLLAAAAQRLPNNPQVIFNAALAALKYLDNLGWDDGMAVQARGYIESVRRLDAANPRLVPLIQLYQNLHKRHRPEAASTS